MSNKIKTDREIMTLKIQAIKDSLKPERTLRKIASLKSNLNFLWFLLIFFAHLFVTVVNLYCYYQKDIIRLLFVI